MLHTAHLELKVTVKGDSQQHTHHSLFSRSPVKVIPISQLKVIYVPSCCRLHLKVTLLLGSDLGVPLYVERVHLVEDK